MSDEDRTKLPDGISVLPYRLDPKLYIAHLSDLERDEQDLWETAEQAIAAAWAHRDRFTRAARIAELEWVLQRLNYGGGGEFALRLRDFTGAIRGRLAELKQEDDGT